MIMDSIFVPFEDTILPVPREYHVYLTSVYGDYMTPRRENYKGSLELMTFVELFDIGLS